MRGWLDIRGYFCSLNGDIAFMLFQKCSVLEFLVLLSFFLCLQIAVIDLHHGMILGCSAQVSIQNGNSSSLAEPLSSSLQALLTEGTCVRSRALAHQAIEPLLEGVVFLGLSFLGEEVVYKV